jgi:hypothetical protein
MLAKVADNPAAAKLFRDGGSGSGTGKNVHDQVVGIAAGKDDAFKEGFGFLGGVILSFI